MSSVGAVAPSRDPSRVLYTIGHARDEVRFKARLAENGVRGLVDVRLVPMSRAAPWTGRHALAKRLAAQGIDYTWLVELGNPMVLNKIGGKKLEAYRAKHGGKEPTDFQFLLDTQPVQDGIKLLERKLLAGAGPLCIMCSEETWIGNVEMERCLPPCAGPRGKGNFCHRYFVARALSRRGFVVRHILPGGEVEDHADPPDAGSAASRNKLGAAQAYNKATGSSLGSCSDGMRGSLSASPRGRLGPAAQTAVAPRTRSAPTAVVLAAAASGNGARPSGTTGTSTARDRPATMARPEPTTVAASPGVWAPSAPLAATAPRPGAFFVGAPGTQPDAPVGVVRDSVERGNAARQPAPRRFPQLLKKPRGAGWQAQPSTAGTSAPRVVFDLDDSE